MVERVVETRAEGDPARAARLRTQLPDMIGSRLRASHPALAEAMRARQVLMARGLQSRCLEVGVGPDAEMFTMAPALGRLASQATRSQDVPSRWFGSGAPMRSMSDRGPL